MAEEYGDESATCRPQGLSGSFHFCGLLIDLNASCVHACTHTSPSNLAGFQEPALGRRICNPGLMVSVVVSIAIDGSHSVGIIIRLSSSGSNPLSTL